MLGYAFAGSAFNIHRLAKCKQGKICCFVVGRSVTKLLDLFLMKGSLFEKNILHSGSRQVTELRHNDIPRDWGGFSLNLRPCSAG